MRFNSTIQPPPEGRQCRHPLCGSICRKKKEPAPRKPIPKVSAKRKAGWFDLQAAENATNDTEQPQIAPQSKGAALNRWFEKRRQEMTGVCAHCQGKSCRDSDQYFKFSICHLLPKAYFPSVATHPDNWIELCFWKNNCHGNMDNKMLDLTEMNCWSTIIERFVKVYPSIAMSERRRIPSVLLQYVETE